MGPRATRSARNYYVGARGSRTILAFSKDLVIRHRSTADSGAIIISAEATSRPSTSARVSNFHILFDDRCKFAFKII
jgi:hypothetical protein